MLRIRLKDKPKGRRAPMKVNCHHLNLFAPAINTISCQKLARMKAAHG